MYGLLRRLYRVLIPRLPVVTAQDDDLSLLASQRRKVWHLDDDGPGGETRTVSVGRIQVNGLGEINI